jgi:hypothetical protein
MVSSPVITSSTVMKKQCLHLIINLSDTLKPPSSTEFIVNCTYLNDALLTVMLFYE